MNETDRILEALSGGGWPGMGGDDDGEQALPRGMAGMTVTSITTGSTSNCNCPLNAYMRIARLVLNPAALVDLSYVADIKIGTISLNIGTQPIAAAAFARDAIGTGLEAAVWASPSVFPVVSIFNNTGGTVVYSGGLFGRVSLGRPAGAVAS
jgi:hypothetical protein